jgi:hypothetical protein
MSASETQAATVLTSENAAEFYAQRMGLAAQDEPTEAAEADPVESDEGQNESEADAEPEQKEAAADEPEKKSKPKIEKRIGEVVKQREQAKAEAAKERAGRESAEAKLREYEQKAAPEKAADPDAEPKPEQFTDAFEYARALAEFSAEKALKDRDRQEAEKKAATERQQTIKQWTDRITAVKADLPDFEDVVASSDVAVSDQVRDAILESDVGPQVLYHLAENPEFAQKLSEMSTITALREIGKLEARFEKKEPAKAAATKQRAPAPIRPIKGGGSAMDVPINSDGVFHGSYQAWKQARLAGKIR